MFTRYNQNILQQVQQQQQGKILRKNNIKKKIPFNVDDS